jgi:hypothetical protein
MKWFNREFLTVTNGGGAAMTSYDKLFRAFFFINWYDVVERGSGGV